MCILNNNWMLWKINWKLGCRHRIMGWTEQALISKVGSFLKININTLRRLSVSLKKRLNKNCWKKSLIWNINNKISRKIHLNSIKISGRNWWKWLKTREPKPHRILTKAWVEIMKSKIRLIIWWLVHNK